MCMCVWGELVSVSVGGVGECVSVSVGGVGECVRVSVWGELVSVCVCVRSW